jgi:hypothetical protein
MLPHRPALDCETPLARNVCLVSAVASNRRETMAIRSGMLHVRLRWLMPLVILCLVGMSATGCTIGAFGGASTGPPAASPHIPGVHEVQSVFDLLERSPAELDFIGSALLPDEAGVARSYLAFEHGLDVYAVRPDGSDLHRIYSQLPCFLDHVGSYLSPDGQWLLCNDRSSTPQLWLAHLPSRGEETSWTALPVSTSRLGVDVTWSPDGTQIAVPSADQRCAVHLFAVSQAHDALRLIKTLLLPELQSDTFCPLTWAGWSPEGRFLALTWARGFSPIHNYLIDLTALPLPDTQVAGAPALTLSTARTPAALRSLGSYDGGYAIRPAWLGDGSALVVNGNYQAILTIGLSDTAPHKLLPIPIQRGSSVCAVGGVVSSRLVAFVYCYNYPTDRPSAISGPGDRLYVFDPAAT